MNKKKKHIEISNCSIFDNKDDVHYLKIEEPPKTGWDLDITPDFTMLNTKPINWFNRKMQELILGFKWKRQKLNEIQN